ncbi:MAG: hypothetical protein ACMXYC_02430 [Candidatus Woesearchaeota archaeon]
MNLQEECKYFIEELQEQLQHMQSSYQNTKSKFYSSGLCYIASSLITGLFIDKQQITYIIISGLCTAWIGYILSKDTQQVLENKQHISNLEATIDEAQQNLTHLVLDTHLHNL